MKKAIIAALIIVGITYGLSISDTSVIGISGLSRQSNGDISKSISTDTLNISGKSIFGTISAPNYKGPVGGSGSTVYYMQVRDEKPKGTHGGAAAAGLQFRTLNTVVSNEITGASLSSNEITLPAGTYRIRAVAPARGVAGTRIQLKNTSDNTYPIIGTSGYVDNANFVSIFLLGKFTIAGIKTFKIEHFCSNAFDGGGIGLGLAVTQNLPVDTVEVYTSVEIWKET